MCIYVCVISNDNTQFVYTYINRYASLYTQNVIPRCVCEDSPPKMSHY